MTTQPKSPAPQTSQIGLSLMTVHACKFSRFIANRVRKRRTGPFVKGPGV